MEKFSDNLIATKLEANKDIVTIEERVGDGKVDVTFGLVMIDSREALCNFVVEEADAQADSIVEEADAQADSDIYNIESSIRDIMMLEFWVALFSILILITVPLLRMRSLDAIGLFVSLDSVEAL